MNLYIKRKKDEETIAHNHVINVMCAFISSRFTHYYSANINLFFKRSSRTIHSTEAAKEITLWQEKSQTEQSSATVFNRIGLYCSLCNIAVRPILQKGNTTAQKRYRESISDFKKFINLFFLRRESKTNFTVRLQKLRNRKMRQNAHIGTGRLDTVACKKNRWGDIGSIFDPSKLINVNEKLKKQLLKEFEWDWEQHLCSPLF